MWGVNMQQTAGKKVAAPDLRRSGGLNYRQKDALWGYALIAIPLIGMLIFTLIPFGMSVYASFTGWPMGQPIAKAKMVGFKTILTCSTTSYSGRASAIPSTI